MHGLETTCFLSLQKMQQQKTFHNTCFFFINKTLAFFKLRSFSVERKKTFKQNQSIPNFSLIQGFQQFCYKRKRHILSTENAILNLKIASESL